MLTKSLSNNTVMGFARFQKLENVSIEEIIEGSLAWSENFLSNIDGIGFHCLLQNLKGELADIILAEDQNAMVRMNDAFGQSPDVMNFMSKLNPDTIQLTNMKICKSNFVLPQDFSAVEIGFMKTPAGADTKVEHVLEKSDALENNYLNKHLSTCEHFIGELETGSYADVTFGRTLGEARKTCLGFEHDPYAQQFLKLFEPESCNLDFWSVLA